MSTFTRSDPATTLATRDEGRVRDPLWTRVALAALLVLTAAFWTLGLSRNGWANVFYSAAVQAGTQSWKAFLFGSSDGANSITVDKPPASLWPMEISARIFGLNTWSIQLPQVLLGVASVALLYVIVKKTFGPAAGLIAGVALALTPVATLMFRFNNPDAMLVFLMVAAVWALLRAIDDGRTRWLLLCGGLLGFGFLTKQLQVFLVLPGMALTYLVAGPPRLLTRMAQLLGGLAAMVVAAGWWVALVELWPADSRPYIGGSSNNSFLDLTFGYNGLGRLTGHEGGQTPGAASETSAAPSGGLTPPGFGDNGIARMFSGAAGGQISWLLPTALLLLVVGLAMRGRRPRTDPYRAQYLVWGGWLVGTAVVFSYMSGIFHDYYTIALAPAVAALVGIGTVALWRERDRIWATTLLAVLAVGTAGWAWVLLRRTPDFVPWLRWAVLAAGALAAVCLIVAAVRPAAASHIRVIRMGAGTLAIAAALAGPLAYSVQTVGSAHTGGVNTAGPSIPGSGFPAAPQSDDTGSSDDPSSVLHAGFTVSEVSEQLAQMLHANASDYTWVAATPGSSDAGYYQLATGDPVMAIGGFGSGDPSPTLEQFQEDVAGGRIHYYIQSKGIETSSSSSGNSSTTAPPGSDGDTEADRIRDWVAKEYTTVTVDDVTLYDLTQPV